jgi:hypothetical protein
MPFVSGDDLQRLLIYALHERVAVARPPAQGGCGIHLSYARDAGREGDARSIGAVDVAGDGEAGFRVKAPDWFALATYTPLSAAVEGAAHERSY